MTPSKGRIVLALVVPEANNGDDTAPAVITRVWNDRLVNVKVLGDSMNNEWKTSISLFDTEEEAREKSFGHACFWPPRV
jgi:hypothetical protein